MIRALAERFGQPANRAESGRLAKAAQLLVEAAATPDEVTSLAEVCVARWGPAYCTPSSLASNVSALRAPVAEGRGFADYRSSAQKALEPVPQWREINWREEPTTTEEATP